VPGKVKVSDWGLLDYKEAWDRQEALFKAMVDAKFAERASLIRSKKHPY